MKLNTTKLSRAVRIVKTPRRWTEIAWRIVFRLFRSKRILRTVECAYANSESVEARLLRHDARVAFGFSTGNFHRARGYTYVAFQLQSKLAHGQRCLGVAQIGFEDLQIYARTTDGSSSRVYLCGFDENVALFRTYRARIAPGTTAVDVGANLGIHTLVLSCCVGQNGSVYSYEPNQDLCERIRENVVLNGIRNVTVRNVGAAAADSVLAFQPREGQFNIGLGRFEARGPVNVTVVKLESDLRSDSRISLIKVDVEGMELDVIRGANALLAKHRPALVLECNREWTLKELRDHIPYPVTISSIPLTLLDQPQNLDGAVRYYESHNILVEAVE